MRILIDLPISFQTYSASCHLKKKHLKKTWLIILKIFTTKSRNSSNMAHLYGATNAVSLQVRVCAAHWLSYLQNSCLINTIVTLEIQLTIFMIQSWNKELSSALKEWRKGSKRCDHLHRFLTASTRKEAGYVRCQKRSLKVQKLKTAFLRNERCPKRAFYKRPSTLDLPLWTSVLCIRFITATWPLARAGHLHIKPRLLEFILRAFVSWLITSCSPLLNIGNY